MNKNVSIIIALGFIISIGIIFLSASKNNTDIVSGQSEQNVEIVDGIQYITIEAKGGYSPKFSKAQSGIPTKLIIKTNSTYDCSSSLVIRSIGYRKILPQTGEEIVDLGKPEIGSSLQGMCSMGMYNFLIDFS